jgi:hypothetical protein
VRSISSVSLHLGIARLHAIITFTGRKGHKILHSMPTLLTIGQWRRCIFAKPPCKAWVKARAVSPACFCIAYDWPGLRHETVGRFPFESGEAPTHASRGRTSADWLFVQPLYWQLVAKHASRQAWTERSTCRHVKQVLTVLKSKCIAER